ncbi:hypothetical protein KQH65_08675 [archaeon]|nr:hypothetical protein [archaeon]
MSHRHSRRFFLFSVLCIIGITAAVVRFSGAQPLSLKLEIAGQGITPGSTCVVGYHGRQVLPCSFSVGRVNELTMHTAKLFTEVSPGLFVFGFESMEPVDCCVILDDDPNWCYNRGVYSVLVNVSECYEYYHVFEVKERGILSFCFKTDTETYTSVTLMAVKDTGFTRHTESSAEVNEAVDTARAFLELNGVDAGRYLSHEVQQRMPNYYWHKVFKYTNLAHLIYHKVPAPCEYVAICFEQEHRPGHFYEVWVELGSNQVVGGDTCR